MTVKLGLCPSVIDKNNFVLSSKINTNYEKSFWHDRFYGFLQSTFLFLLFSLNFFIYINLVAHPLAAIVWNVSTRVYSRLRFGFRVFGFPIRPRQQNNRLWFFGFDFQVLSVNDVISLAVGINTFLYNFASGRDINRLGEGLTRRLRNRLDGVQYADENL